MKRVFLIGCPRSGTTWMALLLAQHPAVAVFQHAKLFQYLSCLEHWWKTRDQGWGKSVVTVTDREPEVANERSLPRVTLRAILSAEKFYGLCGEFASGILDEVASSKPGATVVVDKTPENVRLLDLILKVFPDAYILHVIRDPRAVFGSLRNAGRSWARFEFPTRAIDGARFWRSQVEAGREIRYAAPHYREVQYEALVDQGAKELGGVFTWLDLPWEPALCEAAVQTCAIENLRSGTGMPIGFFRKGAKNSWSEELSTSDIRKIEYLTSDLMDQLGYERIAPRRGTVSFRIRMEERCDRAVRHIERALWRVSKVLLRRWRGREVDQPEFVLY